MHKTSSIALSALVIAGLVAHHRGSLARAVPPHSTAGRAAVSSQDGQRRDILIAAHAIVPRDEIVGTTALHRALLTELQARYRRSFESLRREVAASGATLVVAYLSPEFESDAQKALEPFLRSVAVDAGIEYVNLMTRFRGLDPRGFTQMPRDGHLSASGALMVAEALRGVLIRHSHDRTGITWRDSQRPPLLGDLEPARDVILDGGKGLPYRLRTNRQGLRLDHELTFPKARQRILLLGDSQLHGPFLDGPQTIGARLQILLPDREIATAANLGYGLDDLAGLFHERARFMEPDLVVVAVGGGDVFDTYFSHRNLFSRTRRPFEPTAVEAQFEREIVSAMRPRP